jgi:hypothetical protein
MRVERGVVLVVAGEGVAVLPACIEQPGERSLRGACA